MIPRIKKVLHHGNVRYQINLGVRIKGGGKYQRKFFKSAREARKHLNAILRDSSKVNREFLDLTEVSRPQSKRKRPEILSLEQITLFLQTVCKEEPNLLAPIAFSLFCGIRTKEVFKFHWTDIDLINGTITIFEYVAKGDRPRKFKISDQLRAWLEFCPNKSGKVNKYPTLDNYWDVRKRIYRHAGIKKMPRNALRKSFSSYDWSLDQDTKRLCAVLGNSPNVAMRFYVDTEVDPEEGKKFKQLLPKQKNPNTEITINQRNRRTHA